MIDSSVPVENLNQRIHGMDDCERQAHHADSETTWQNQYVERLIDSIRRDCLDHTIVLAESHLRKIMTAYKAYYNEARTHLSLSKDTPLGRPIEHIGSIIARPMIGGLHHRYVRI